MNRGIAAQTGHGISYGVFVRSVLANSPAPAAGLPAGSVIIAMAGQPVANLSALRQLMMQYEVGDEVEIVVALPTGERRSLTVRLGKRAAPDVAFSAGSMPPDERYDSSNEGCSRQIIHISVGTANSSGSDWRQSMRSAPDRTRAIRS